ncbi:PINIT domain-containing protein [Mycena belliarum]|uniref:PINIT domain-containing protein n=1 Tax=Mycena belliarum TaxID=1033014 RepID=A0AAD6UAH0_9AGAR|nr:PINIT domain-containing protein [Mycena belliae]
MAASNTAAVWSELDATCKAFPYGTVADLKQIILSINNQCGTHMIRSGRKQELVDRLSMQLGAWKSNNDFAKWMAAKPIIDAIHLPVSSFMPSMPMASLPAPRGISAPYLAASNPAQVPLPLSRSVSTSALPKSTYFSPGYRFKQSPFYSIDQVVSSVLECPESYTSSDRRECTLQFTLNDEQLAKLRAPGSPYQLRLFCTSSKFYSPGYNGNAECLVEFPPTCEIYVNDVQLKGALLKGIKKRPGTAPPPDLGVTVAANAVRMIYINSGQGQLELKKYYLVAQLVKAQTVSALVDQLRTNRFVSGADIRRQMVAAMPDDDEIIAGSLKMSLKCPLSFMRISTPCRSSKCTHSQCFDATSWYSMMQQTTTWLCPVCENTLDWRELIIDGYFAEILKTTPDSVDDVLIESDGEWRTADGRYSSSGGGAAGPPQYELIDSDSDSD